VAPITRRAGFRAAQEFVCLRAIFAGIAAAPGQKAGAVTTTIAVIGATGTAGSRVTTRLQARGLAVVQISRAQGVDIVTGQGLSEALEGVDVVIDVSNPKPTDGVMDFEDCLAAAGHNLVGACVSAGVQRLVVSTVAGIDDPLFDEFPYFVAKRAAQDVVLEGSVPATIVKSTAWYESAINPAAVDFGGGEVVAQDWLLQPIAADTVADVLVEAALGQTRTPRTITGPETIRLPELVSRLLTARGDHRRVRVAEPALAAFSRGALLGPEQAIVLGPDVETWLDTVISNGHGDATAVGFTDGLNGPNPTT
jgi:uncharacterized protein YbjT (DUF2867 family)